MEEELNLEQELWVRVLREELDKMLKERCAELFSSSKKRELEIE